MTCSYTRQISVYEGGHACMRGGGELKGNHQVAVRGREHVDISPQCSIDYRLHGHNVIARLPFSMREMHASLFCGLVIKGAID